MFSTMLWVDRMHLEEKCSIKIIKNILPHKSAIKFLGRDGGKKWVGR